MCGARGATGRWLRSGDATDRPYRPPRLVVYSCYHLRIIPLREVDPTRQGVPAFLGQGDSQVGRAGTTVQPLLPLHIAPFDEHIEGMKQLLGVDAHAVEPTKMV